MGSKIKKEKIFKKDIASISYVSGIVVLNGGKELMFREERNVYDLVLSFNKEEKK